jgi:uncharacterized membrane protein
VGDVEITLVVIFALLGIAFLVLWVGGAIWVLADASQRNARQPVWWAVGVLLCGPIALIAYLIDRPKGRRVTCTFCGQDGLDTDRRCPFCDHELPTR